MAELRSPESLATLHDHEVALNSLSESSTARTSSTAVSLNSNSLKDVDIEKSGPIPSKRHSSIFRHVRQTILSVYRRLFSIVFLLNTVGFVILLLRGSNWASSPPLADFATAASANVMVALLIRQEFMVNALFKSCYLVPHSAPLQLRCILAKIYEYGGIHSGAGVSATIWFCLFTGFFTNDFVNRRLTDTAILTLTYILVGLLLGICIAAYPRFRFSSHNTFENVHRWGGYMSLAIFWAEIVLFAHTKTGPLGIGVVKLPATWFLFVASIFAALPWLRLRRVQVRPEKLSNHAIRLHFAERTPLGGYGIKISDSPLTEWHSFASIPSRSRGDAKSSVLISNAGDWTKRTIQSPRPYYYLKGIPIAGVLGLAQLFRRVIIVTTGSGIGPCLAVIQDFQRTSCRVIWSTPSPEETYGAEICGLVERVDRKAVIWDTRKSGRPDLVRLAWDLYREEGAEAIFVISNKRLTKKVVYGMESRGIPAYGPIFDS